MLVVTDTVPQSEAYKLLSHECEEILLYMVKQPKMGDFQQMRMPISSTQGDTQVPNTVLWLYVDQLWGHVQQEAERLAAMNGISMRTFPFDETDMANVEEQVGKVQQVIETETSAVLCVVIVTPVSGCAERVAEGIAAVSAAAKHHDIRLQVYEVQAESKLELAEAAELGREILKTGHSVMDMRVLQILEKGRVMCEQVLELQQVRFGKWGKPAVWPEYCRTDGIAAERPDVRLLPFESGGVWIWLGEWKIQGGDDTDDDGWQYLTGMPRGNVLPQEVWNRKAGALSGLRRRKHWCFRQRLQTTAGLSSKLESADWTFVRDFQTAIRRMTLLTTASMNKVQSWSEQRTLELQVEAKEIVQGIIMTEDGSQERGRGSDEIAAWLSERLSTGNADVAKKTLLIIDSLIDVSAGVPTSFRSMLRMRTAAAVRDAMSLTGAQNQSVVRISTECNRRLAQVPLPARANCVEGDLLRVHKTLQRLQNDPLRWELTKREQDFMWNGRRKPLLTSSPRMLSVVLLAVPNWDDNAEDAHSLLKLWHKLSPAEAIQLLDSRFWRCASSSMASPGATPNAKVCSEPAKAFAPFRAYAVDCLEALDDTLLCSYLLQLALVLRDEELDDGPLAAFLLRRALAAPFTVGHCVYWQVRAEMAACVNTAKDKPAEEIIELYSVFLRLGMFLRSYLNLSGEHEAELLMEEMLVDRLRGVVKMQPQAGKATDSVELMDALIMIDQTMPEAGVRLPIDADKHVSGLIVEKCRVMSSATKPMMLQFKKFGHPGEQVGLMFKDGDDLRQDGLCLQVFGFMKHMWAEAGLNVPLTVYKATDLGAKVGMLELVTGAETLSAISVSQRQAGQSNVAAVLDNKKMARWLESECGSVGVSPDEAKENFLRSSAGCCVATYILGIGDRHNDNIMMRKDGHLVHIDFGFILGKNPVIPTPFGFTIDRYDSEVFAFLPDFGYIIGGDNFQDSEDFMRFQELCCECYLVVRQHANLFINLFSLLLPAGLYEEEELSVMRQRFNLEEEDEVAATIFKALIVDSLGSISTKFNWALHTAKHVGI